MPAIIRNSISFDGMPYLLGWADSWNGQEPLQHGLYCYYSGQQHMVLRPALIEDGDNDMSQDTAKFPLDVIKYLTHDGHQGTFGLSDREYQWRVLYDKATNLHIHCINWDDSGIDENTTDFTIIVPPQLQPDFKRILFAATTHDLLPYYTKDQEQRMDRKNLFQSRVTQQRQVAPLNEVLQPRQPGSHH